MTPSPKPHERQALALAALVTIGTVLTLLAQRLMGGALWL